MKYNLMKKKKFQKYFLINVDDTLSIKKKHDKESMGTINFYDEKLISGVIRKNIKQKLKKLLELIVSTSEEGDHPDSVLLCLNEEEKFKKELINKYEKYLEKKQKEKIDKKLELIEKHLKDKLIMYAMMQRKPIVREDDDVYEEEMEHHRSR